MHTESGLRLSHYRLIEKIGEGGMGVVWKAEDTSLRRRVAIKFLTASGLSGQDRRARFQREARLAASLNHPSICSIYEVAEVEQGGSVQLPSGGQLAVGTPYLAMEFIEGQPLDVAIRKSRGLPPQDAIRIATQVAEGLAVAHERKIVHRDLKPANVMLLPDERAKILDFGLAKNLGAIEPEDAVRWERETIPEQLTRAGTVVGTVAYMSPEQAKGAPLDSRSDIFSFGIMLYEMVCGQRPFRGDTSETTRLMIIEADPEPMPESCTDVPLELERILDRCLRKDPKHRYNDTRDLVVALEDLRQETSSAKVRRLAPGDQALARRWPLLWWALAGVAVVAAVLAIVTMRSLVEHGPRLAPPRPPSYRQITFTGSALSPDISPDGQYVAYLQEAEDDGVKVMVQDLAGGDPLEIFRTTEIWRLRWSPDGTQLAVVAWIDQQERGETHLLPRLGGRPRRIRDTGPWLSWSPDGRRLTSATYASKEITIIDTSTGETSSLPLKGSFIWLMDVEWSPDGRFLAFVTEHENGRRTLWTIPPEGGEPTKVVEGASTMVSPRWSGDGSAIYYLEKEKDTLDLWKAQIDPFNGKVTAEPSVVLAGLQTASGCSLSRDGTKVVFAKSSNHANLWLLTIPGDLEEHPIEPIQLTSGTAIDSEPSVSPDGQQVAFLRQSNIFVVPLEGGPARQLTFAESQTTDLAWSPDGTEIAFVSSEGGTARVCRVAAQGGIPRVFEDTTADHELIWSPGTKILYQTPGSRNFRLLDPRTEDEKPLIEDDSVGWAFSAQYSPDGTQVAVYWNRERRQLWTVSVADSSEMRIHDKPAWPVGWSIDGAWLYAWNDESSPARAIRIPASGGEPETVFEWPFEGKNGRCWPDPDVARWVCTVGETRTDIWLVENFDPDVN